MKTLYKFRFTLILLVVMLMGAANMQAQRYLKIAGVTVTTANCGDLTVIPGVSGTSMTYDFATQTLRMEDITINLTSGTEAIRSDLDGEFTIEVVGTNNISSLGWASLQFETGSVTILGNGTLNVENYTGSGKYASIACTTHGPLTIKNCTVNVTDSVIGIGGWGICPLIIDSATITARGIKEGSITGFPNVQFNGSVFAQPIGAKLSGGNVTDINGNIVKDTVKIIPGTAYDLWVWGTQVTSANYDTLAFLAHATSGAMTYDHATQTLTLNGVSTNNTGDKNTIKSSIDGLTIDVVGENTLKADGLALIDLNNTCTIQGGGILNIENTRYDFGINVDKNLASITIKNCDVNITSPKAGIRGTNRETLTFDNATVTAKGTGEGSITNFSDIILNNCFVSKPAGAKVSGGKVTDASGSTVIKDTVKIEPIVPYDLWICNTQVTNENCGDLTVISGVSGTSMTYDHNTKTLLLEDITINIGGPPIIGINSEIEGLKIEVVSTNTINQTGWSGIKLSGNTTILGGGTLNVNNRANDHAISIYGGKSLTIQNCTLSATGGRTGIAAGLNEPNAGTLTINNAAVTARGDDWGSIVRFTNIVLTNSFIIEPPGAKVSGGNITEADGTTIIKDTVKIIPLIFYDLWICRTRVTNKNCNDLTVISGVTGTSVTYNPDTKTLRLKDASLTSSVDTHGSAIQSQIEGLKIEVVGNNTINGNGSCVLFQTIATIFGDTLNIINDYDGVAIRGYNPGSLTIDSCTINATGGIAFHAGTLYINKSTVTVVGGDNNSFSGFTNIVLNGCFIDKPVGAKITNGSITYLDGTTIVKDTVKIIPGVAYNLWVCGVQVTDANKDDLTIINGTNGFTVRGTINYNSDTKVLRLEDTNITLSGGFNGIRSHIPELQIEVVGNDTINSDGGTGVELHGTTTISGGGMLSVTSQANDRAIYSPAQLTIENCKVSAVGGKRGIMSYPSELIFTNATVIARGASEGSITNFSNLTLNDCMFFAPADATINGYPARNVTNASGTILTDTVIIVPNNDLYITKWNTTDGTFGVKLNTNQPATARWVKMDDTGTTETTTSGNFTFQTNTGTTDP